MRIKCNELFVKYIRILSRVHENHAMAINHFILGFFFFFFNILPMYKVNIVLTIIFCVLFQLNTYDINVIQLISI